MWTYQEILLASNPVIVCGESHIQWSRLALSIVSIHFDEKIESWIPKFPIWSRLVIGRISLGETNRSSSHSQSNQMENIQAYQLFITKVLDYYNTAMTSLFVLELFFFAGSATCIVTLVPKTSYLRQRAGWLTLLIIFLVFLLLHAIGYWIRHFRPPLGAGGLVGVRERRIEIPITENLIDGAISRKAKEPKDKAFALHAILQQSLTEKLPTPDYNLSTGQVYKSFSRHLIEATNSLDILVPAAWKGYPGQPSWTPDWTQLTQGSLDLWQNHQRLLPISKPYWVWDLTRNRSVLKVRGLHISNVSSGFKFQKTSDKYLEDEKGIHFMNFAMILALFSRHHPHNNEFNAINFTAKHISIEALSRWQTFFYRKSSKTPLEVLSLLTRPSFSLDAKFISSRRSILRTQISICNELAETKRMFFASEEVNGKVQFRDHKKPKASTEFLDGICKDNVQVGDKLIYISGLSSFVIVRAADDGEFVRLISPAVMGLKTRPGSEELFANRGVNLRPNVRERDLEEFALA
jgi:hypothetical protein